MRRLRAILFASVMTGVLAAPTSLAHAQTVPGKEVAKRLFEEGFDLEKRGDYVAALAKYKDAEQILATPGLRFHKGYCLEMTGKLNAALEEYEVADKLARDANRPEVHAAVIARLEPLRTRIPQIAIRLATVAKDAEVQLDGNPVGSPLLDGKAFRLDPGEHAVTARAPGHRNFVRHVQVPESLITTVDVVLDLASAASAASPVSAVSSVSSVSRPSGGPSTEPPSETAPGRSLVIPIVATAGAVALVVAGVAFIAAAGGAQSDAQASCPHQTTCTSEQSKVRTFDALALGSFIGGAGLGVLSAVFWASKGGDRRAAIGAKPTFGGATVGVEGAF